MAEYKQIPGDWVDEYGDSVLLFEDEDGNIVAATCNM